MYRLAEASQTGACLNLVISVPAKSWQTSNCTCKSAMPFARGCQCPRHGCLSMCRTRLATALMVIASSRRGLTPRSGEALSEEADYRMFR